VVGRRGTAIPRSVLSGPNLGAEAVTVALDRYRVTRAHARAVVLLVVYTCTHRFTAVRHAIISECHYYYYYYYYHIVHNVLFIIKDNISISNLSFPDPFLERTVNNSDFLFAYTFKRACFIEVDFNSP